MRRLAAGALAGLFVPALGRTAAPTSAAATAAAPKVVLIVGATHGATASYRSRMSEVAATAARYSRKRVEVYSPNATWSAVRSALQGASIAVFMGHGNGFPSPYSATPNPDGVYTSRVVATDGVASVTQAAKVAVNAFRVSLSDSTPARGQLITAAVVTTEPLRAAPRMTITQPGRAPVSVTAVRLSASTYRATVRLSSAGRTGALALRVTGYDADSGYNSSSFAFPIH